MCKAMQESEGQGMVRYKGGARGCCLICKSVEKMELLVLLKLQIYAWDAGIVWPRFREGQVDRYWILGVTVDHRIMSD